MPRRNRVGFSGSGTNLLYTRKQKGHSRKGSGVGTYSKKKKGLYADRYDRPYLSGRYSKEELVISDAPPPWMVDLSG